MNILATIFGMYIAILLISVEPNYFISHQNFNVPPIDGSEEKKHFYAVFKDTFQANNPLTEFSDIETRNDPTTEQLRSHYQTFETAIQKIHTNNCPQMKIAVPSRFSGDGAIDRTLIVFDTNNCHQ